jgi:hypothetical protein
VEDLVEARYTRDKRAIIRQANLRLEKLHLLLRLCHDLHYLPHTSYEHAMRASLKSVECSGDGAGSRTGHETRRVSV